MRKYDNDDDSFEAEDFRSYKSLCPEGGDVDAFAALTRDAVAAFKDSMTPSAPKITRARMKSLRKVIAELEEVPEALEELGNRELRQWQDARPEGTWFDDEWNRQARRIRDGGSALDVLKKAVAEDFEPKGDHDAAQRKYLIARAAYVFSVYGGSIEAKRESPFWNYIDRLLEDAGLGQADSFQAIQRFLAKNGGVLD
jgi:hypothetical protein